MDTVPGPARSDDAPAAALLRRLDHFVAGLNPAEQSALATLLRRGQRAPALAALAAEPAEAVLEPAEIEFFERLRARPAPSGRGLPRQFALIMKGTRLCNLRCTYCRSWSADPSQVMSFEVLAHTVRGALQAPGVVHVDFLWHGGESTMRPVAFYRKALWLEEQFRGPGQAVGNLLQTNGTNLTPRWLDFLERYRFKVGVSLDGPPEVHDRRRIDAAGRPTSARVRQGLSSLQARGIEHEVKMVVDDDVVALGAERLLVYLLEIGASEVALLNVVPEGNPELRFPGDYLHWPRYVELLRELFRLWWPAYADRISLREIADLMAKLRGGDGAFCVFGGNCMGAFLTIEPSGEVAACDRYQGDGTYRFGNVLAADLAELPAAPALLRARAATDSEVDRTRGCSWFHICQGGCPHDRYVRVRRGVSHDEHCCGWAPLIADIAAAIGRSPVDATARAGLAPAAGLS